MERELCESSHVYRKERELFFSEKNFLGYPAGVPVFFLNPQGKIRGVKKKWGDVKFAELSEWRPKIIFTYASRTLQESSRNNNNNKNIALLWWPRRGTRVFFHPRGGKKERETLLVLYITQEYGTVIRDTLLLLWMGSRIPPFLLCIKREKKKREKKEKELRYVWSAGALQEPPTYIESRLL